jgi:hypothetical protein
VLFNIPEGNKRENPTSYMSITNQKYKSLELAEEAELKATQTKENKPPASAGSASLASNQSLVELDEKIKKQGELVRDLKAQKASKVTF